MPSPFPGTNPYLECPDKWPDFHHTFMVYLSTEINRQLKSVPGHVSRINLHYFVKMADLDFNSRPNRQSNEIDYVEPVEILEGTSNYDPPVRVSLPSAHKQKQIYLTVTHPKTEKTLTIIEMLIPFNKTPGSGFSQFQMKRQESFDHEADYVEIDLLRGGARHAIDGLPLCDYYVMSYRKESWPRIDAWPFRLHDPLPRISIPVGDSHRELVIDVKTIVDQCYDSAGYDQWIYGSPPVPKLSETDNSWAAQFIPKSAKAK